VGHLTATCAALVVALAAAAPAAKAPALPDFGMDEFTIAAWVKTSGDGTILAVAPAEGDWAPQGKSLFIRGGVLNYDIGWVACIHGRKRITDGQWHHVALTGPSAYEFFVDGQSDGRGNLAAGPDVEGHVVRIGFTSPNFPSQSFLKGLVDEVRIYARKLSAAELKALAEKPDAVEAGAAGPVARWTMDGDPAGAKDSRIKGEAAWAEGRAGKALVLDGKTWVEAPRGAAKRPPRGDLSVASVRAAVTDLLETHGAKYPRGKDHLASLDSMEKRLAEAAEDDSGPREALAKLAQEALVRDHPLLDFGRILFIKRKTYQSSHYYTDYIDGCKFFGGNLSVLDLKTGEVTDLVPELKDGIFGRFDLDYDARHIVFDWKKALDKGFRIYEVGIDGRGLRQLTFDAPDEADLVKKYRTVGTPTGIPYITGTDDMHPCYLPDGDIAFVSTRCQKGILCDGPDVLTTTVLYRMGRDGQGMRPISFNTVSEATPSVAADGRILYTRWEYVDKGGSACKCLWAMRPDGTGSVEIYGNNISHPVTFIDCRDIPGRPDLYVCTSAPHMPLGVGGILRLNTTYSLRTLYPITKLTPEIDTPDEHGYMHLRGGRWVHDLQGPLLREPYPLSEKYFLVTYNPDKPWNEPTGYGLYLLDEFGNRVLIHKEAEWSCWGPQPLRSRPRPPVLTSSAEKSDYPGPVGTLILQDVYVGLTGIERGRVKYLRIMEDLPRPWSARRRWDGDEIGQQHAAISFGGHLAPKIEHGVVPVEADGSAWFQVPADKNVFFQALDENYMELQRMRTFVNLRPGEVRGCVGCHEEKRVAPAAGPAVLALRRTPSQPVAQPGETVPRAMHYPADVQPILDKRCVSCHSAEKPNGIDLSGTMTALFSVSYENLVKKRWAGNVIDEIGISGTGGKHSNIEAADPLTYGSPTSKLVAMLRQGHQKVELSREEFIRLVTWIDANAPYYGTWDGRRNVRYKDLPDFRPNP